MLIITTDRNLPADERAAIYGRTLAELLREARAAVDAELADPASTIADSFGVHPSAMRALLVDRGVRSLGAGRIEVDADLYRGLSDDTGLIVLRSDDEDDIQPAPDAADHEPPVGDGQETSNGAAPEAEAVGSDGAAQADPVPDASDGATTDGEGQNPEPAPEVEVETPPVPPFDPKAFANVGDLRDFATANDLNLHGASKRADIEQAITDGLAERATIAQADPVPDASDGATTDPTGHAG